MYAFVGDIRVDTRELRRDVHCFKASLSEQDLESVAGQSGRAKINLARLVVRESQKGFRKSIQGFRRTIPSTEKWARPSSFLLSPDKESIGQGVGSS